MALTILNYSRLCHNYSIYSNINKEVNKDVKKKEVVCTNLIVQVSRIQGHEIRIVLYARLDSNCRLY